MGNYCIPEGGGPSGIIPERGAPSIGEPEGGAPSIGISDGGVPFRCMPGGDEPSDGLPDGTAWDISAAMVSFSAGRSSGLENWDSAGFSSCNNCEFFVVDADVALRSIVLWKGFNRAKKLEIC